ncbi:hypothetical protein LQ327_09190 [Actinomycetospora endophytica]|uniref:Uncharacterized protein n=1 Tax=Actinomycetospora endophytica TaxID=2291215 RepID=A0ABS8P5L8_9PSEU|nr:hypothetical protein [Actinomycetospora endophytica]MCD2193557.1 hypothetical protein [Actinomycetospora endophytica]
MSDFLTRLDENNLTTVDCLLIRSLYQSIRAAEVAATRDERKIPPEWCVVIVRTDDLEQA